MHCTAGLGRAPAVAVCLLVSFLIYVLLPELFNLKCFWVNSGYTKGNNSSFNELNKESPRYTRKNGLTISNYHEDRDQQFSGVECSFSRILCHFMRHGLSVS